MTTLTGDLGWSLTGEPSKMWLIKSVLKRIIAGRWWFLGKKLIWRKRVDHAVIYWYKCFDNGLGDGSKLSLLDMIASWSYKNVSIRQYVGFQIFELSANSGKTLYARNWRHVAILQASTIDKSTIFGYDFCRTRVYGPRRATCSARSRGTICPEIYRGYWVCMLMHINEMH